MNIVWDTASTGRYWGTVFSEGVHYSLVNNVCGVRYSLGYRIHSDTGPVRVLMKASRTVYYMLTVKWVQSIDSNQSIGFDL